MQERNAYYTHRRKRRRGRGRRKFPCRESLPPTFARLVSADSTRSHPRLKRPCKLRGRRRTPSYGRFTVFHTRNASVKVNAWREGVAVGCDDMLRRNRCPLEHLGMGAGDSPRRGHERCQPHQEHYTLASRRWCTVAHDTLHPMAVCSRGCRGGIKLNIDTPRAHPIPKVATTSHLKRTSRNAEVVSLHEYEGRAADAQVCRNDPVRPVALVVHLGSCSIVDRVVGPRFEGAVTPRL